jgi:hypothetical protein
MKGQTMKNGNVLLSERSGLGAVKLSGGDSIFLTIGPITINLAPAVFAQAAILIREAMESLAVVVAAGELYDEGLEALTTRSPLPN